MMKIKNINLFLLLICLSCSSLRTINKNYNLKLQEKKRTIIHPQCPPGAYYESCGSGCGLRSCNNLYLDENINKCPDVCVAGCVCTGEKVLDKNINECVEVEDCSYY